MVGCHGGVVSVWNSSFRALGRVLLNMGWSECFKFFMVWSLVAIFSGLFLLLLRSTVALSGAGRIGGEQFRSCPRERIRRRKLPPEGSEPRWPHGSPQCPTGFSV